MYEVQIHIYPNITGQPQDMQYGYSQSINKVTGNVRFVLSVNLAYVYNNALCLAILIL